MSKPPQPPPPTPVLKDLPKSTKDDLFKKSMEGLTPEVRKLVLEIFGTW